MVQNHVMQVLALVLMESPVTMDAEGMVVESSLSGERASEDESTNATRSRFSWSRRFR